MKPKNKVRQPSPKKAAAKKLAAKKSATKAATALNAAAKRKAAARGGPLAPATEPQLEERLWNAPPAPKPDYIGDPASRNKCPAGRGKPIVFPPKGENDLFQRFLWELVNQMQRINLGQAYFKASVIAGESTTNAEKPYRDAVIFYKTKFFTRWENEMKDPSTQIDPVISAEGYVLDVRVISKAFSDKKPGQSSSETIVYPYPSSSSSSSPYSPGL